jgi:putative peptidoglycan lipid II flippase
VAFFVVPSAVAFLAFGDLVAAALLQTGRFRHEDALYVWGILAGSAVALPASTFARVYSSAFYALRDTRTPLTFAIVHVAVATVLGVLLAIVLPGAIGVPERWGAAGLTFAAGMGGWAELALLRRVLRQRVGAVGLTTASLAIVWSAAVAAAAAATGVRLALGAWHPILVAAAVLAPYGAAYLALTMACGVGEGAALWRRLGGKRL